MDRFGLVFQRLPPLDVLAKMSLRAAVLGVVFLAVTIGIGILWASQSFPGFYQDPKFILTVFVWMVYAIGISLHYGLGRGGRRTIYFSLVGFALIVLSVVAARLWLPSFHGFM